MRTKLMALGVMAGAVGAIEARKRLRHRNADWLRNDQGVGPAHYRGTHRGEARITKKGPDVGRPVDGG